MDRCGRKLALQIASMPLILGWILIGFASNHGVLLLGRLVAGISAGLTAAAGQVSFNLNTNPISKQAEAQYSIFSYINVFCLSADSIYRVITTYTQRFG